MAKDLHILFLSAWYPHRKDSMFGLFVKRHAEAVAKYIQVSCLYAKAEPDIKEAELIKDYGKVNTFYFYYPMIKGNKWYSVIPKGFAFVGAYFKLYKELRKEFGKPDIVHANILTRIGFIAFLFKLFYGIPYIITEHWSRYLAITNTYHGRIRKWLTRFVVKKSETLSCVTENLRHAMASHQLQNVNSFILPNVVDDVFFDSEPIIHESKSKCILHISCFENRSKNVFGIIEAIKVLSLNRSDFKLVMVGDGEDHSAAVKLSNDLGLNHLIEFRGILEGEELVEEFKKSNFLLLYSNYENLPVVINESFAMGKPVLTTNVGGISEIVNNTNGILIDAGDEVALIEGLNDMIDDVRGFDEKKIARAAKELYSAEAIGKLLLEKYHEINDIR